MLLSFTILTMYVVKKRQKQFKRALNPHVKLTLTDET